MNRTERDQAIERIRRLRREIRGRSLSGEFQDDSDIFELDRRLMEAELRWPRSTLRLYFEQYRLAWIAGLALLVLGILLVLAGAVALGGVVAGIGAVLILAPVAAWYQSRPFKREE
jgi:hypothetical protein